MNNKTLYVVGFMFCVDYVLLVEKLKPIWQAGLWNGVGGKFEAGESARDAMPREFKEETGIETATKDWTHFATEIGSDYVLYCCKARNDSRWGRPVPNSNDVGEQLVWHQLPGLLSSGLSVIGNLHWLIPLALDWRRFQVPPVFFPEDDITEKPTW